MLRWLAVVLLALAGVVQAGLTAPAARERDAARAGFARAGEERERLRLRGAELERRAATHPSASEAADGAAAARELRRSLLRAAEGVPVRGVHIAVTGAEKPPRAAHGQVSAEGRFPDLLLLAERLGKDPAGFVLARVSLARSRDGARLEAEGFTLREGW